MNKKISSELAGVELVGTASTFYTNQNDSRFELALENAEKWRDNNLPYIVVDASPRDNEDDTWVQDAHELRGATVIRANLAGIATQRKQGVAHAFAHGAEKVVGHEPEKVLMSDFAGEIARELNKHQILIIGRTAAAQGTLPTVQSWTEAIAGWVLEQTHNLPPDALSGGRGFTRGGAEELAKYPATETGFNNWIYLYRTPIEARAAGLSVGGLTIDLLHPPAMTAQEQDNSLFDRKRYDQFKLQLDYLMQRADIDRHNRPIADAVIQAMNGLTMQHTNKEFEQQLRRLEQRLGEFGYRA
jgi:hypothetical protein